LLKDEGNMIEPAMVSEALVHDGVVVANCQETTLRELRRELLASPNHHYTTLLCEASHNQDLFFLLIIGRC